MSTEAVQRAFDEVWCRTGKVPAEIQVSTVKSDIRDVATVTPDAWWGAVKDCLVQWGWWGRNPNDDLVDEYAGRPGWRYRGVDVVT